MRNADCVDAGKGLTNDDAKAIKAVVISALKVSDLPISSTALKKVSVK